MSGNVAQGAAARCPAFGLPATCVVFYRVELAGWASSLGALFASSVAPPGGTDAPLCVSCGKKMSCHKQAAVVSSAAFLLLEVNRSEGSMCSLSGFDNIRVNK